MRKYCSRDSRKEERVRENERVIESEGENPNSYS
jgi:hypothetical protein